MTKQTGAVGAHNAKVMNRFELTKRLVNSKRFITLALCAPTAPVCLVMGGSSLEHFAAGQQRREDEDDRGLHRHRLLDRAVDDKGKLVLAGDRVSFDAERIEHRS